MEHPRPRHQAQRYAKQMKQTAPSAEDVLDRLAAYYGPQCPDWPTEPFQFLVWWNCGYPASDAACHNGWKALNAVTSVNRRRS